MTDGLNSFAARARQAAIEHHLIAPDEAHLCDVRVIENRGSRTFAFMRCGDRTWIVKHAGGPATLDGDWQVELALYRAASASGHYSIAPELAAYSEAHELMIIEAQCDNWTRLGNVDLRSPWSVELVAQAATSLARWHQACRPGTGIEPCTPWVVALLWDPAREPFAERGRIGSIVDEIVDDPALRSSLEQLESSWQQSHVVHGDLSLDKILVHSDGSIRLLDWELSGWGDPRWDIAGLLQELRTAELEPGVDTSAHRAAVLASYAERATSPSPLSEDDPTLQAFIASRLIVRALQLEQSSTAQLELAKAHLNIARAARSSP